MRVDIVGGKTDQLLLVKSEMFAGRGVRSEESERVGLNQWWKCGGPRATPGLAGMYPLLMGMRPF